jgi:hypothetical protein
MATTNYDSHHVIQRCKPYTLERAPLKTPRVIEFIIIVINLTGICVV